MKGELDLAMAVYFRSVLEPLIDSPKSIVLNLKELAYIDSTGMGILIFILKARNERKLPFTIQEVPAKIQKLFDLTGITKFLSVEGDPQTTVKADGM
ncbi:STAS domain-containing protein [Paenibacillus aurantius]|uniref:Anti-sigma factor antagonist n=2 Tax=Paenibacillus aurantius TaxID=2918900 RepID=A0AA96LI96_9BACL|nr:STAS domain-containing protein [Paenibacillus aurantius]WNQ14316.1 STAS domain-containing protein [Paenibacillus aurantius]